MTNFNLIAILLSDIRENLAECEVEVFGYITEATTGYAEVDFLTVLNKLEAAALACDRANISNPQNFECQLPRL